MIDADGGPTVNTYSRLAFGSTVATNAPFGLNATDCRLPPSANGEPLTGASVLPDPTADTDSVPWLPAIASSPFELKASATGASLPVVTGELLTGVSAPPDATENSDAVWSALAVARSPPLALNATEC